MDSADPEYERRSVVRVVPPAHARKLAKVPFVELAEGRLQGVVSSGSDVTRVYVSAIDVAARTYSCSTNNNRPCGGLGYASCNHLRALLTEATAQYGIERVAKFLRLEAADPAALTEALSEGFVVDRSAAASTVFSSFLRYLSYLEIPVHTEPVPELHWFPATGGGR